MQKVAFIVNPKAGVKKKLDIPGLIRANFSSKIPYEILVWGNKNDFLAIKNRVLNEGFTIAVAVGGDGTVNEVAKTVNHTEIALGIIPFGSGNGLARSIGVPLDAIAALRCIERGNIQIIDSGLMNDHPFFCTSGIGFDAHIGALFASSTKRGFWSYTQITLKELLGYKTKKYSISFNNQTIEREAFLITFANAGQYGNDFYIAPAASMQDGLLHMVIVKPFPLLTAPALALKIFGRKAESSRYIETFASAEIKLSRPAPDAFHIDGEPQYANKEMIIKIVPGSLKVVC